MLLIKIVKIIYYYNFICICYYNNDITFTMNIIFYIQNILL